MSDEVSIRCGVWLVVTSWLRVWLVYIWLSKSCFLIKISVNIDLVSESLSFPVTVWDFVHAGTLICKSKTLINRRLMSHSCTHLPRFRRGIAARHATLCLEKVALLKKKAYRYPTGLANGRLRVGYVSSDYGNHPTSHLMQSVPGLHDTSRIEVGWYSSYVSCVKMYECTEAYYVNVISQSWLRIPRLLCAGLADDMRIIIFIASGLCIYH